ncbi:MAG: efflux RND transporter periplasmic adaptor subunit [Gammaproteobacteria bacterium]|nr:efflux RND transporter periplasmic adaptor subunit [Gammaproteobacteria bacterium]
MNFLKNHPILVFFFTVVLAVSAAVANRIYIDAESTDRSFYGAREILVVAEPVRMEEYIEQIEAIGTARANESVNIIAKVTETVSKVHFEDGMVVDKGRILVELSNAEEIAQLSEAQANLDEAALQYRRVQNLISQNLASQMELDEEKARHKTAAARLDAISARLDDRLIRTPFAGVLGFRYVSPGTLVTTSTVITTLDDISSIKLDFTVPEIYLSVLHTGLEVFARSDAFPDRKFKGEVSSISSRVDPVTRSVVVRAILPNKDRSIRPGMLLKVNLIRSRDQVKVVPEASLVPIGDKQYVFRVNTDKQVDRVMVNIGRRRPGSAEIISGLQLGALVVTEGVIRLSPGSKVRLKKQSAETEGN